MAEQIVRVKQLQKHFGKIHALDGLDFTVNRGDIYGFLGANGSGKSTTIRIMLGLIYPDSGQLSVFGKSIRTHRREILHNTGVLIERPDFYNHLSAYKNLQLLASYSKIASPEKTIMEKLEMVGLSGRAHSKLRTFSQGMKQRLGLAQTLLHDPELIILDEPVNGLDPQGIKDMRKLILSLNRDHNKTLLISSHILREMELIANRMVVISKGKTLVEGEVKQLLSAGRQKLLLVTSDNAMAIKLIRQHFPGLAIDENRIGEIQTEAGAQLVPEINKLLVTEGLAVTQLQSLNSLEDYFLHIT